MGQLLVAFVLIVGFIVGVPLLIQEGTNFVGLLYVLGVIGCIVFLGQVAAWFASPFINNSSRSDPDYVNDGSHGEPLYRPNEWADLTNATVTQRGNTLRLDANGRAWIIEKHEWDDSRYGNVIAREINMRTGMYKGEPVYGTQKSIANHIKYKVNTGR